MNIGIIGAGKMGSCLGAAWIQSGHNVRFSYSRSPHTLAAIASAIDTNATICTPAEAAQFGEVILLAVHWPQVAEVTAEIAPFIATKIVLTCVLPWNEKQNALLFGPTTSAAEEIAKRLPGASIVESLPLLADTISLSPPGQFGSEMPTVFCCGDDIDAKATVAGLVEELGMEAVDAGTLQSARYLEPMTALLLHLAQDLGEGPHIAFKMLRG